MCRAPDLLPSKTRAACGVLLCAGLLLASCEAVPPTAPSPTISGLSVLYSSPTRPELSFQVRAYAIDSDAVYTDVTEATHWSTSNPALLEIASWNAIGGKVIRVTGTGSATLLGRYEGFEDELLVTVPAFSDSWPLALRASGIASMGRTLPMTASFYTGPSVDVTATATWTSSDPSVATVESGVLTPVRVGTTRVGVVYQDRADYLFVSVHPRGAR